MIILGQIARRSEIELKVGDALEDEVVITIQEFIIGRVLIIGSRQDTNANLGRVAVVQTLIHEVGVVDLVLLREGDVELTLKVIRTPGEIGRASCRERV